MSSNNDFSGKVAIITGASSGIGQTTAILFAQRGASVVLCGQNQERLDAAVESCKQATGVEDCSNRFTSIAGDVSDSTVRKSIIAKAIGEFGKIDILIPSAGVNRPNGDIFSCTEETYDSIFNTNVKAVFFLIQEALPYLEKSRGNIVTVSSLLSTTAFPKRAAYPMSKAAVDHMTRCLSLDLAPKGIRVNAVNPSFIPTRVVRFFSDDYEELGKIVTQHENPKHPLNGECITTEDVANTIAFLASDAAKRVTGQCHIVDGGRQFTG